MIDNSADRNANCLPRIPPSDDIDFDQSERGRAVHVAVAVIWRSVGGSAQILLTQRPDHVHLGGYWEYPGGKIDPSESVDQAARREVLEETGIALGDVTPLITVEHQYTERLVRLHAVLSQVPDNARIQPRGIADWRWVPPRELHHMKLPPANQAVTERIMQVFA
jgi:8-oxo-dGTP diphosphatase